MNVLIISDMPERAAAGASAERLSLSFGKAKALLIQT